MSANLSSHAVFKQVAPQYLNLHSPRSNHEVVGNAAPRMALQGAEEEAEANEDHHVDVLEGRVVAEHASCFVIGRTSGVSPVTIFDEDAVADNHQPLAEEICHLWLA